MGRNPATGEAIKIPSKTVVKMRVDKAAKEAIVPIRKQGVRVGLCWIYPLWTKNPVRYCAKIVLKSTQKDWNR